MLFQYTASFVISETSALIPFIHIFGRVYVLNCIIRYVDAAFCVLREKYGKHKPYLISKNMSTRLISGTRKGITDDFPVYLCKK